MGIDRLKPWTLFISRARPIIHNLLWGQPQTRDTDWLADVLTDWSIN